MMGVHYQTILLNKPTKDGLRPASFRRHSSNGMSDNIRISITAKKV